MLLCTLWFIGVFIASIVLEFSALGSPVINSSDTSTEQKVFHDCQNTDYRTYIQCLKRQKRHHFDHGHPDIHNGDYDHECMESCLKKCNFNCDTACKHCIRKTKHRHQIITEYETECISGKCTEQKKEDLPNANITTNINIHNIINGSLSCCNSGTVCPPKVTCPPSSSTPYSSSTLSPSSSTPHTPYPPNPPHPPHPPHPPFPPFLPFPPFPPLLPPLLPLPFPPPLPPPPPPLFPPLQPPLPICPSQTCYPYSFMYGQNNFGCQYWNPHPCIQTWTNPVGPIDCSGCGYNYTYNSKCHIFCYYTTYTIQSSNCKNPYCVDGTYG